MSVLAKLSHSPKVEHIDDERSYGNSIIVTLKQGWTFDRLEDNRVSGADTVQDTVKLVLSAVPFAGPYTT